MEKTSELKNNYTSHTLTSVKYIAEGYVISPERLSPGGEELAVSGSTEATGGDSSPAPGGGFSIFSAVPSLVGCSGLCRSDNPESE